MMSEIYIYGSVEITPEPNEEQWSEILKIKDASGIDAAFNYADGHLYFRANCTTGSDPVHDYVEKPLNELVDLINDEEYDLKIDGEIDIESDDPAYRGIVFFVTNEGVTMTNLDDDVHKNEDSSVKYTMLITYSFDSDYISVPCATIEEAEEWREKYLRDEIETVKRESEYTPSVINVSDNETVLVYGQEFTDVSQIQDTDCATYMIIELGNGHKPEYFDEKGAEKKEKDKKIKDAEQCLIDNGIDPDEADTVLQALGYILMDKELYPED